MALTFNQDRFQGDKINLDEVIVLAGEQELVRQVMSISKLEK